MSATTQKREAGLLDGMPEKRLYWSIISDYDVTTGLCELIDNAIDLWMATKPPRSTLRIELHVDYERQLIHIKDTAGGVKEEDLRLLIAPGASKNDPNAETIGIFGVGSKRAVVALAENVVIKTRYKDSKTYQIDIDKDWLASDDWRIPHYEIPDIEEGVTTIDLSALRKTLVSSDEEQLIRHLGETYEWFLNIDGCVIEVNAKKVIPVAFDIWADPPSHEPQQAIFNYPLDKKQVGVEITAGLIRDRDPIRENYGVYFYCNNRLVVKELRSRDVGYFVGSEAGVPHPDASLCRVIVKINGPAKLMPWNSSKSGINFGHVVFQNAIRSTLIQLVSHFSSLSRRLKDDWGERVFKYDGGKISRIDPAVIKEGGRIHLPSLPKVNKPHVETLKAKNKTQIDEQPWTLGLVEAVAAVSIITRQKLATRNRIALIVLDSNFEIALKEFIVHRTDLFQQPNLEHLFKNRDSVINTVNGKFHLPPKLLAKAKHYYNYEE